MTTASSKFCVPATCSGIYRDSAKRKEGLSRSSSTAGTPTTKISAASSSRPLPDLCFPVSSVKAKSFLPKSGKMKAMNWNPKKGEVMATIPRGGAMSEIGHRHSRSAPVIALVGKEESSVSISACGPPNHREKSHGIPEESQEKASSGASMPGELPRFRSEDNMSLAATIGAQLADNYGVFSVELDRKPAGEDRCEASEASNPASKLDVDGDATAMEVPIQLAGRERRPKIQVTIPQLRPLSAVGAHRRGKKLGQQMQQPSSKSGSSSRMVSPASSITPPTIGCGNNTAPLSVISPISVVEMPRPRRPFSSGFSLQGAEFDIMPHTVPHTAPLPSLTQPESAVSDSSDDAGERDDRSSVYSLRSSLSSLGSDNVRCKASALSEARRPSLAFSVLSPADAGVFDTMPLTPRFPRNAKSTNTLATLVNRNKPLPPEPTTLTATSSSEVAPLNLSGQSRPRTGSMKARRKIPAPLDVTKEATDKFSRRFSRAFSLRSKYTPADLDALDDAFKKTSPQKPAPSFYSVHTTQTLSQAELALEAQLLTISEDAPFIDWDVVPLVHDPLQIKRGPMHMEPSRPAPSPPTRNAPSERAPSPRKKLQKRSPSHVALQLRAAECAVKRVSLPMVGSSLKAHRVLGTIADTTGSPTCAIMARDASTDSTWSSSESPRLYALSAGSDSALSLDSLSTPESVASSVDDATFEEVRKRMQLLGPKPDQADRFSVYCDTPVSPTQLPLQQQIPDRTSLDTSRSGSSAKSHIHAEKQSLAEGKSGISVSVRPASPDESHIHPLERRGRKEEKPVRSLASITMSEIPEMYASLPSPRSTLRPSMTAEEMDHAISAEAAEMVLLRILQSLDNLADLFATATVSRGFYRTFKRHELALMKGALFAMSAAAWELREMSPAYPHSNEPDSVSPQSEYTPSLYLRHYMDDMYIMIHLKSMILLYCESFLRADTIKALAGAESERSSQIDNAFWRVWTFCRIFGCGKNREDDIVSQIDWLKGGKLARQQSENAKDTKGALFSPPPAFGRGNGDGLTAEELYDMEEIWTCLGVLLRGFHGKREEAREHGIFNGIDIAAGNVEKENVMLGELHSHINTTYPLANDPKRGMDLPSSHTRSLHRFRCHFLGCHTINRLRPRPLSRLHHLVSTHPRLISLHFPQGSHSSRLRREDEPTPPLTHISLSHIANPPRPHPCFAPTLRPARCRNPRPPRRPCLSRCLHQ